MNSLTGKRVLVTRPRAQSTELIQYLKDSGATPVSFPAIEIKLPEDTREIDQAIAHLAAYQWVIFTSVNGVFAFWQRMEALGLDHQIFEGVQVAAIGPATAQALTDRYVQVAFMPEQYIAEAIVPGLGEIKGARILLPRADIARKALFDALVEKEALPHEIPAYSTQQAKIDPSAMEQIEQGIDLVLFTSSSTVRNTFAILGEKAIDILEKAVIACIGPITAQTAQDYHLTVDITAAEHTIPGLIEAIINAKLPLKD